jgi:hypothetical protein
MRLVCICGVYFNPDHVVTVTGGNFCDENGRALNATIRVTAPGTGVSNDYHVDELPATVVRKLRGAKR